MRQRPSAATAFQSGRQCAGAWFGRGPHRGASPHGSRTTRCVGHQWRPTIEPHVLPKVFEPYWRPPSSTPGGGLGLGLYICKKIVEAHGGTLEVCSSAELGTCFTRPGFQWARLRRRPTYSVLEQRRSPCGFYR
ncbi:sensor histidine kinase [Paraburkholderia sp. GAS41]|uniref:sensor histidine kinase n=1 Tax=Paraburkholderia sp. GAS41 TaxID=3035134 RepID=UPI003D2485B8